MSTKTTSYSWFKSSLALLLTGALLLFSFLLFIAVGAKYIPLPQVLDALFHYKEDVFEHLIIWELRFPRALIATLAGASLSVSGVLIQGITRNPLAEPSILGIQHGASLAVVASFVFFGVSSVFFPLIACLGALAGALLVWFIARKAPGGISPLTLILSGAAVTAFLAAIIAVLELIDSGAFEELRVWLTGSLAGREIESVYYAGPFIVVGLVVALLLARQMNAFTMGEEAATGLGVNILLLKVCSLLAIVTLTAASVTLAGPLGFIGLVIPHVTKLFVGYDYRKIIPFSILIGAIYLLLIDIIARTIIAPQEISTGIMTSLLGAPLFVWLVRVKL